jgi:hypothetical protein
MIWPVRRREDLEGYRAAREHGTSSPASPFRGLMMDPFNRAERCRARAEELRAVAAGLHERDARIAIRAVAASLDLHARNLEAVAVKFRWGHLPSRPALPAAAD